MYFQLTLHQTKMILCVCLVLIENSLGNSVLFKENLGGRRHAFEIVAESSQTMTYLNKIDDTHIVMEGIYSGHLTRVS